MGDRLVMIQMALYCACAAGYAWDGNFPKVLYFVGALVLTVGVFLMR